MFTGKCFRKHRGIISFTALIPILTVALLSAALCFAVAFESTEIYGTLTESLEIESAFLQAKSVLFSNFKRMLQNGEIVADFSDTAVALSNPVINFNASILDKISEISNKLTVNAYIVDGNYSIDWLSEAQRITVPQRKIEKFITAGGIESVSKRYMLVIEIKPKNAVKNFSQLFMTEIIATLSDGYMTIQQLHTQRKQIYTE